LNEQVYKYKYNIMTEKSDFITLPTTFENYKWYKPILVIIVTLVIYAILTGILVGVFSSVYGGTSYCP